MVELGYKAATEQIEPRALLDYAVQAEEAGFDSVWASDHFHPWMNRGQAAFTWTWLGALGQRTGRVRFGTEVTCPTLRYHPAIIAQAAATLAAMYPDRTFLSVGTGESLNETPVTGVWPEYGERRDRLEEALELMRELWTGNSVSYRGEYYDTYDARLFTRPDRPVPVYVAAAGRRSATLAGRMGDGVITTGFSPLESYDPLLRGLEEGAREAGRDPTEPARCIELKVMLGRPEEAVPLIRGWWGSMFFPFMFRRPVYDPREADTYGRMISAEAIQEQTLISPDPEEHVRRIEPYIQAGFTSVILLCPDPDQRRFIETYGREVLPRLRDLAARGARPQA